MLNSVINKFNKSQGPMSTGQMLRLFYKFKRSNRQIHNKNIAKKYINSKDKLPKLTNHKNYNLFIAELFKQNGMLKHYQRVARCSTRLKFATDGQGKHAMCTHRYACHNRFCSICQMVNARKFTRILETLINYLSSLKTKSGNRKFKFIFLTLTTPNATPVYKRNKKGRKILDKYSTAKKYRALVDIQNASVTYFLRLKELNGFQYRYIKGSNGNLKLKKFNGRMLGSVNKPEATIKHDLSLNSHNHLVSVVHGSYGGKYYITHTKWRKLWTKAVLDTCNICLKNSRHGKMQQLYHKKEAKLIIKNYKGNGKKGFDMDVRKPYFKKFQGWFNGNKKFTKITDNNKTKGKLAHHIASEVSKYEAKPQDFSNLIKHKVSKKNVANIFYSVYKAYKGIHMLKFNGLFSKAKRKFDLGKLDKFTSAYINGVLYDKKGLSKFHNSKNKSNRYYDMKLSKMSDKDKIRFRLRFHLPTTYTNDERHNHFNSSHDRAIADFITGKTAIRIRANKTNDKLANIGVMRSYWKRHVILKYLGFLMDKYMMFDGGVVESALHDALNRAYKGLNQSNIQKWITKPSKFQFKRFADYVKYDLGHYPTHKLNIKFIKDDYGNIKLMTNKVCKMTLLLAKYSTKSLSAKGLKILKKYMSVKYDVLCGNLSRLDDLYI